VTSLAALRNGAGVFRERLIGRIPFGHPGQRFNALSGAGVAFVLWLAVNGLVVFAYCRGGGSFHPP
jgi:hypothetical protein